MKYQIIILILTSENVGVYSDMKSISRQYMQMAPENVKYFYIQLKENIDGDNNDVIEDGDHLFIKGTESLIPGIYHKTIKAIEYINNHYDYKMIMRTNLSSFLNPNNIIEYVEQCPEMDFAGGFWNDEGKFITGTGIFLSRDVGNFLVNFEEKNSQLSVQIEDDVLISRILMKHNVPIYDITNFQWIHLVHNWFDPSHINPDNLLYYRIKNVDRSIDIMWFTPLKI
jgi:hypothetical protein